MINKLSLYRRSANLTQKEFAKKLRIGTVTLSKWENINFDLKELNVKTIEKICEILNVSFSDLVSSEK